MAASPRTPTARKAPANTVSAASPGSKVAGKGKQQRKTSGSQGSPMAGSKRKIKTEDISPKKLPPTKGAKTVPTTQMMSPEKKQKMTEEGRNETKDQAVGTSPKMQRQTHPLTPSQSPRPPQTQQTRSNPTNNAAAMSNDLLIHSLQQNPALLPGNPSATPITSNHIDAIAHAMWQLALNHGAMLQTACQYSTMFSPLKLQALAKLNFLPSWWFMREMAVTQMVEMRWSVDDGEMAAVWRQTCEWCKRMVPLTKQGGVKSEGEMKDEGGVGKVED